MVRLNIDTDSYLVYITLFSQQLWPLHCIPFLPKGSLLPGFASMFSLAKFLEIPMHLLTSMEINSAELFLMLPIEERGFFNRLIIQISLCLSPGLWESYVLLYVTNLCSFSFPSSFSLRHTHKSTSRRISVFHGYCQLSGCALSKLMIGMTVNIFQIFI